MPIRPSEARLWRLLAAGYFPSELPPPFHTSDFAQHAIYLAQKWDQKKISNFWTKPEHFSSPRYGHARRKLSVVNPINQLAVAALLADNWFAITKSLKRPTVSEFKPRIVMKGPGRAITGVDFDAVARRRVEILSTFGRYVKTDVARFYPSIYSTQSLGRSPGRYLQRQIINQRHSKPHLQIGSMLPLEQAKKVKPLAYRLGRILRELYQS